jgi:hypothetical protein
VGSLLDSVVDHPSAAAGAAFFVAAALTAQLLEFSYRSRLLLLLGLGLGVRLLVAAQNPLVLQDWPLHEDSHYYFTIARNLVNGEGLRHDSFHTTTGFQPLYLFAIAPLFRIPDKLLAIQAVLGLQIAVGSLCAFLLHRLARLVASPGVALVAPGIWAVSPVLLTADLNGLETNFAICLLLATTCFYLERFTASPASLWRFAQLGLLCGFAFLARIDLAFLIPILSLDQLRHASRRRAFRPTLAGLAVLGGSASLLVLPWIAYNLAVVGSPLPSSGQAVRFISQAYGFSFVGGASSPASAAFEIGNPPLAYYLGTLRRGLRVLVELFDGSFPLLPGVAAVATAVVLAFRRMLERTLVLWFFFAFLAVLFVSYTGYIFGQWFFPRYFSPIALGYVLVLVLALDVLSSRLARAPAALARWTSAVAVALALGYGLHGSLQRIETALRRGTPSRYYEMALWVNRGTPPNAVIGAFQTGILGYFVERRFHGLDGKINLAALQAMQARRIDRYVVDEGIDYLMDWRVILRDLFTARAEDPQFLARQEVVRRGQYDVYRLRRAPADVSASRPAHHP